MWVRDIFACASHFFVDFLAVFARLRLKGKMPNFMFYRGRKQGTMKFSFSFLTWIRLLGDIFWENRESQDARQFKEKNLRKNGFGFKRFILKEKLEKVWKIDFKPIFHTKHRSIKWQLREKSERVRNIHWYWKVSELLFRSYSLKS